MEIEAQTSPTAQRQETHVQTADARQGGHEEQEQKE